jgi:hypothetical protein
VSPFTSCFFFFWNLLHQDGADHPLKYVPTACYTSSGHLSSFRALLLSNLWILFFQGEKSWGIPKTFAFDVQWLFGPSYNFAQCWIIVCGTKMMHLLVHPRVPRPKRWSAHRRLRIALGEKYRFCGSGIWSRAGWPRVYENTFSINLKKTITLELLLLDLTHAERVDIPVAFIVHESAFVTVHRLIDLVLFL